MPQRIRASVGAELNHYLEKFWRVLASRARNLGMWGGESIFKDNGRPKLEV